MLLHMHICNIALIDDINIDFEDGLNILTGETGAGKSIIIGSLGICLGDKIKKDILRDESKDGLVELLFLVEEEALRDKLAKLDLDIDGDELLISRRISANGRTISKINGNTVTTTVLKEAAQLLIDLHAQHEQQTLLKASKHLLILDKFGGDRLAKAKKKVSENYREYKDIQFKLSEATMDEADKNKQLDYLKYQIDSIKQANLKPGEDEILEAQYKKAENSKEILSLASDIYELTGYSGKAAAGDMIGHAHKMLKRVVELDKDAGGMYDILSDVDGLLNDFNSELNLYMKDMEFDEELFKELSERLNLINSLKLKYGNTIEDILNSLALYEEEYEKLLSYDEYIHELRERLKSCTDELELSCEKLSSIRKEEAKKLCALISQSLEDLNFNQVQFDMEFNRRNGYDENGYDEAYFMISTNVGEALRPLYEVASGGELSRVMLAMKACLANQDETPTLVFDEIDVGISGRTAQKVAEKMSVIASSHQLICITHLPQIAAMADTHYVIEKNVENNKTNTGIRKLSEEEAVEEIARILGGASITEATLFSAKEMKGLADKAKKT